MPYPFAAPAAGVVCSAAVGAPPGRGAGKAAPLVPGGAAPGPSLTPDVEPFVALEAEPEPVVCAPFACPALPPLAALAAPLFVPAVLFVAAAPPPFVPVAPVAALPLVGVALVDEPLVPDAPALAEDPVPLPVVDLVPPMLDLSTAGVVLVAGLVPAFVLALVFVLVVPAALPVAPVDVLPAAVPLAPDALPDVPLDAPLVFAPLLFLAAPLLTAPGVDELSVLALPVLALPVDAAPVADVPVVDVAPLPLLD